MKINIFSKFTLCALAIITLFETVSFINYLLPQINAAVYLAIITIAFILALYKLEYGLYFVLAELSVGGLGHLFEFNGISIRIGFFVALILAWLIVNCRNRELTQRNINKYFQTLTKSDFLFLISYFLLLLSVILGIITGLINNKFSAVFLDTNAWLYLLLLPVFWLSLKNDEAVAKILQIFIAATSYLAAKTIIVLFLFSHNFVVIHGAFYNWLRDSGVGEITYISGNLYRVFFQSQIYCLFGLFIALALLIKKTDLGRNKNSYWLAGYLYLTSLTVIISQSRSFWVGGLAGLVWFLALTWRQKIGIKKITVTTAVLILMVFSQFIAVQLITGTIFQNRFQNLQSDPAGSSRVNQLEPLTQAISAKPFLGYGYGKILTYISNDPRILSANPTGEYSTFAFEWSYLDIALKIGLIGLAVYVIFILILFYKIFIPAQSEISKQLPLGMVGGLTALCVINIFTPYLNHPLGIGYLLLISAIYRRR